MGGQIVDASIIKAPRQRMTQQEKIEIKAGEIPKTWQDHPAKMAQKDRDARWIVKQSKAKEDSEGIDIAIPFFGYKSHICIDQRHGFIRHYQVTPANRSEGRLLGNLLDRQNTSYKVWGDTAYRTIASEKLLQNQGFICQIHRKKPKNKPMPYTPQKANGKRSKIRACVEHVFAVQKEKMKLFIRTIGLNRAKIKIGFANLTYNL